MKKQKLASPYRRLLLSALLLVLILASNTLNYAQLPSQDYEIINGNISEQKLRNYLKRSIGSFTAYDLAQVPTSMATSCGWTSNDQAEWQRWLDFISYVRPKFIGNTAALMGGCNGGTEYYWMWQFNGNPNCPIWLTKIEEMTNDIHNIDDQIIIEACLTSDVCSNLGANKTYQILIPQWVKTDLDDPAIASVLNNYTYFEASQMGVGANPICPECIDITRPMTIAWHYFIGTQYIDRDIESLRIAYADRISVNDNNHHWMNYLATKLRSYANTHARRNFVLLNGETMGMHNGSTQDLIFDIHNFVLGIKETQQTGNGSSQLVGGELTYGDGLGSGTDYEALIKEGKCANPGETIYSSSLGGNHPLGWTIAHNLFLAEFDVTGGYAGWTGGPTGGAHTGPDGYNNECHFPRNWDEFSWYTQRSELYRNQYLIYAWHRVRCLDQAGYLLLFGCRPYKPCFNCGSINCYKPYNDIGGTYQADLIKNIWDGNETPRPWSLRYYNRWANMFYTVLDWHPNNYPTGKLYFGDFDADGHIDILETADVSKAQNWAGWKLYLQSGGNFNFNTPSASSSSGPGYTEVFYVGDYNGDGKDDFIVTADDWVTAGSSWHGHKLYLSSGSNFNYTSTGSFPDFGEKFYPGDYDGDGKDDIFVIANEPLLTRNLATPWSGYQVFTSTGSSFSYAFQDSWPSWGERLFMGDFNGDGKTDFLTTADKDILQNSSWGGHKIYHSNGSGFDYKMYGRWPAWGENFIVNDWNQDGHDDYTVVASNNYNVNWLGSKTYICNDLGNHFIYAFDDAQIGLASNTNATVYSQTRHLPFRNSENYVVAAYTTPSVEGIKMVKSLHCDLNIWSSEKHGTTQLQEQLQEQQQLQKQSETFSVSSKPKIGNAEIRKDIAISPNPSANGIFHMNVPYSNYTVQAFDLLGKKVYEKMLNSQNCTIDLSKCIAGQYILAIKSEKDIVQKRVVIK